MLKSTINALRHRYQEAVWALPVAARGAATAASTLPLCFPTVGIWGANTGVGKTLFSAGLAAACSRAGLAPLYLKPVQTGFPLHSDSRLVALVQGCREEHSPHAASLLPPLPTAEVPNGAQQNAAQCRTMFAWQAAVSPHLAVELEGRAVPDEDIVVGIASELAALASGPAASRSLAIVETAGGVASPGPSGALQCDLLRPLRLPGILVGDGRLGGISATIAAHESLVLRGYDVPVVAVMDGRFGNAAALRRYLGGSAEVLSFPECQPAAAGPAAVDPGLPSADTLEDGGSSGNVIDRNLAEWLAGTQSHFDRLLELVMRHHEQRVAALNSAADEAREVLWWPFTQHGSLENSAAAVTVIDSRSGEHFAVFQPDGGGAVDKGPAVQLQYDACASWWTQGVNQAAQPALGLAVGRAAARYGHVIFPQNVHQPALQLAQALLGGVGAGWASRVFYTDNGSTAVEVALKMAFRRFMVDHRVLEGGGPGLEVLGLQEAYHGDTLGCMDAVASSVFNGRRQTPWYTGRGLFLDPPTAAVRAGGAWEVRLPAALQAALRPSPAAEAEARALLEDSDAVFSSARGGGPLAAAYRSHVEAAMDSHAARRSGAVLGAAILEPAVQGAGGMRLVDPLFQRAVMEASRARGIPVIFDEVFTGFWRLGAPSAAALLGVHPDIACYAKLLTGGVVPLSATLATDAVFQAFSGDSKAHALLHGHSYTAHPIGCSAALQALSSYTDPRLNPNVCTPAAAGRCRRGCATPCGSMLPMWDSAAVRRLAALPGVSSVLPLGTVLALELESRAAGYSSEAAAAVVRRLRGRGVYARPLGNVVYLMVTPMTARAQCDQLVEALEAALGV